QTKRTTAGEIARAMVGGELPSIAAREFTGAAPCFAAHGVSAGTGPGAITGVSFEVNSGEIVGIAGVEGNGQTGLADAIAHLIPYAGRIKMPESAAVGIIPQDRQTEGLVLNWSI